MNSSGVGSRSDDAQNASTPFLLQKSTEQEENVCQCFDREVINVHPRVVLAFLITFLVMVNCGALLFYKPEWNNVLLPIMSTLCGLWVPSPTQSAGMMKSVQRARHQASDA